MNLGLNKDGNNWKYAAGNFGLFFGVQLIFSLNDLMGQPEAWPSVWWLAKTTLTSAITTLIFYGYNKRSEAKKDG